MLKDITKIKLSGAIFDTSTTLDLFNPHEGNKLKTTKGALLYGRNGTGKSTIAKAIRKLAGESMSTISNAAFYDDANQPINLSEEEKKQIFVFDEDYVDRNVRLQQNHLETIVMLGPAVDLSDKIKRAEEELTEAKTAYEQQEVKYAQYLDINDVKSPKHYIILLRNALKGDDNWAGRDREIHGSRQNTGVRDDTYKKFITLAPSKAKTELIIDYKAKYRELEDARNGISTIDEKVPTIPQMFTSYDDKIIQQLLAEKIDRPELSEREKRLFALVQEGKASELSQRLTLFRREEVEECPYCFQAIASDYKMELVESIEKVLSKKVETHQKFLKEHICNQININLQPYEKLDGYQKCIILINEINLLIQEYNAKLQKKIENPYEAITMNSGCAKEAINRIVKALEELEKARIAYNKTAKKTGPIIVELERINSEIAYYDVKDLAAQLEKQQEECLINKEKLDDLKKTYETKKKVVEDLEAQRKNVEFALESINACMKYIFFADNRLTIEYVDGVYKLFSHGKSVKPCDVSVGERNIIGLSYFFTSMLEGKEEKDAYGEEYLLVIDDPVSSYDIENRIGILSFLKYKMGMFLEGNPNTKALVMTHDLKTFYDIHKLFEEIMDVCKQKGYSHGPKFNRFEMKEKELQPFSYNNRQEYTEILESIYKYANGDADEYELIIGNMMRQVLEAFATFEYKKGIEAVSTDVQILGLLPEQEYVSYYKNLMYRLVLHGGSHKEEQIKTMNDFNFFSLISKVEKQRTARDILCFIYLLNERHLLEHLKKCGNVETEMKAWCQDIKSRAAVI